MIRLGLGLMFALFVSHEASAGDIAPSGQAARSRAGARCAALGEGFFTVAGSDACVRISGRISAGAGFGTGAGRGDSTRLNFEPNAGARATSASDWRFDASSGPDRVYLNVERNADPR